jgi:hypothetical protein
VISPVPVTLKRFFALEFVFTFGIIDNPVKDYTLPAFRTGENFLSHVGNVCFDKKIIKPFFSGCKDKVFYKKITLILLNVISQLSTNPKTILKLE